MMVLITTRDPFELELNPGHEGWFTQWKGQVRGALEAIRWYPGPKMKDMNINDMPYPFPARSRLYRSQILQVNLRLKALFDEIYKIYMLLHLWKPIEKP